MPLFVGASSKAMPQSGIAYITDEKKAELCSVQNLDPNRDLAEQFTATAKLHGHYEKASERKYYHFKLSPDPTDYVTAAQCHVLAEQLAEKLFKNHECVISTHTDTPIIHAHIIINAVNYETGKKLDIRNHAYGKMKDLANTLGAEQGMSVINFRKRGERLQTPQAMQDLQDVLEEAKHMTTNMTDFKAHLRKYGVIVRETKNTISYLHPQRKKPIRGERLGAQYTKGAIIDAIEKQRNGRAAAVSGATERACGNEGTGVREHFVEEVTGRGLTTGDGRLLEVEQTIQSVAEGVRGLTPEGRKEQEQLARAAKQKLVQSTECQPAAPIQHKSKSRGISR